MDNFDFLIDDPPAELEVLDDNAPGPNLNGLVKMDRKKFGQAILQVFQKLGGVAWLFNEAKADPKAFMSLLSKMVPKQTVAEDLDGLVVKLIDRYGNELTVNSAAGGNGPGQPALEAPPTGNETATGGTPDPAEQVGSTVASGTEPRTKPHIKERYG